MGPRQVVALARQDSNDRAGRVALAMESTLLWETMTEQQTNKRRSLSQPQGEALPSADQPLTYAKRIRK